MKAMRDLIQIVESQDQPVAIHKLEQAGLGKAPFRITGMFSMPSPSMAEQNPSAYNAALRAIPKGIGAGSCALCGRGIVHNYVIKSSDGETHVLGSECINRIDDVRLTTQAKEAKRLEQIEKRRAEAKRRYEAHQQELQAQRDRNNGFTDSELAAEKKHEERLAKLAPKIELLSSLADALEDGRGGFRDSIAQGMRNGNAPRGKAINITADILAKQAGRTNSASYNNRFDEVIELIQQASQMS